MFIFTLQHKEMVSMGPTKVFCIAFLRHINNSPASSVTELYLSVFGTQCHRHGKPSETVGALVLKAAVPTAWAPWSPTNAFLGWTALGAALCIWFFRISNLSQIGM